MGLAIITRKYRQDLLEFMYKIVLLQISQLNKQPKHVKHN
jgi:hypothetical protein